jgi:hypothetical protein
MTFGAARRTVGELRPKEVPVGRASLVRYVGWYSNRARGERAKALKALKAQDPATKPAGPGT